MVRNLDNRADLEIRANKKIVAVLSTTVMPADGIYEVKTINYEQIPCIFGVPHYIGHMDTRKIVEYLGAKQANTKLFAGLKVGEMAICFPIAQGKNLRASYGFSSPHQSVDLTDLAVRVLIRIK